MIFTEEYQRVMRFKSARWCCGFKCARFKWINTCIRGFIDQHRVHGHYVGSGETLHILQNLTKFTKFIFIVI